ncbi:Peptidase family M50 [Bacillus sp. THAF10]|uniref:site-2 protease family protein n=1 Tax=Bacillus sp. THAF10 TaxID=2587848 RepID=UPI0012679EEF|nr:site-2 protease family protein [Bacillus sp. THAF10]QFT90508.1 Peptidase family M50 [Bacillus sp. THAF10]
MLDTIVFFYIIVPLVHLIHEVGHVVMAKLHHVKGAEISIGIGPKVIESTIFGTSIRIHIIPFIGGYSTNSVDGELSPKVIAWISAGGPIFNLISIMIVLPFWSEPAFSFPTLFILFSLWIGLGNLLPYKLAGKQSDGWQLTASIIKLVKTR